MPAAPESAWWWSGRITSGSSRDKRLTASGSFTAATMAARFAREHARLPARSRSDACSEQRTQLYPQSLRANGSRECASRWLAMTTTTSGAQRNLFPRLDPLRRPAPQRVAMFGSEKSHVPDPAPAGIGRRHRDDLGLDRGKSRAQQFDRGARRPEIVGHAERAQCALVFRKVLQGFEPGIVEQIAWAH